jgi:hypothetical protein
MQQMIAALQSSLPQVFATRNFRVEMTRIMESICGPRLDRIEKATASQELLLNETQAAAPSSDRLTPPREQTDAVRYATNEQRPFKYPMLEETHRKRAVDFTRTLTAMKGKVGDDSNEKEIAEWRHKVESMAVICFGTHWEVDPPAVESVLRAIHEGFAKHLQSAWILEIQHDPTLLPSMSWDDLVDWVYAHSTHEPYDEGRENRTKLMTGQVMQGDKSLTAYLLQFNRMVLPIATISEEERIVYFMHGLSSDLGPLCQTDIQGQPWWCFTSLVEHARMKDLELRAREAALRNGAGRHRQHHVVVAALAPENSDSESPSDSEDTVLSGEEDGQDGDGSDELDEPRFPANVAPAARAPPNVVGPDEVASHFNAGISNKQCRWLQSQDRCFHCFKLMRGPEGCRITRANVSWCPLRGQASALSSIAVPGAPAWE